MIDQKLLSRKTINSDLNYIQKNRSIKYKLANRLNDHNERSSVDVATI